MINSMHRRHGTLNCIVTVIFTCVYSAMALSTTNSDWSEPEDSETRSIMLTLAISIDRIENAIARDLTEEERQREIDKQLQIIEELGELLALESKDALDGGVGNRSHRILVNNIDQFLQRVELARAEVAREAPKYYLAGKIVGHCQVCHEDRDRLD